MADDRAHRGGERPGQLWGLRADRRPRPRRARRHHGPGPGGRGRVRGHRPRPGRVPGPRRAARRTAGRARPRPGRRLRRAAIRRSRGAGARAARTGRHPGHVRRRPVLPPGAAAEADTGRRGQPGPARPSRAVRSGITRSGFDADAWRRFAAGLAMVDRPLPRPGLRADLPPGDRHLRRGALGDRAGARGVRRRAVPGDRAHAARRRRPGGDARRSSATGSTTCTSRTPGCR